MFLKAYTDFCLYLIGRSKEGPYDAVSQESERDAVADLLNYLENVV